MHPRCCRLLSRCMHASSTFAIIGRNEITSSSSQLSSAYIFRKKTSSHPRLRSQQFRSIVKMSTNEEETTLREVVKNQVTISTKEEFIEKLPEDVWFIRPTGNPANKDFFKGMIAGGDVTEMKAELIEIKHLEIFQDCAYVVLIAKASFDYKGTKNEDIYTQSCLYKKKNGTFELAWAHRSTGRGFNEDLPGPWPTN
jgi:hypothetical protein